MWEIHPVLSNNITVRKVSVVSHGTNNDGCNPESCRDVLIEDCLFDTGDDCIAIKSGRNNDGRRVNVPSENIIIRNCVMKDGHGGVVLGSECSGGIRNVFVDDCEMDSPNLDRAPALQDATPCAAAVLTIDLTNVPPTVHAQRRVVHRPRRGIRGRHRRHEVIDLLYEEGPGCVQSVVTLPSMVMTMRLPSTLMP
jgi:hypothetical protein